MLFFERKGFKSTGRSIHSSSLLLVIVVLMAVVVVKQSIYSLDFEPRSCFLEMDTCSGDAISHTVVSF